jgi:hypothetical protein
MNGTAIEWMTCGGDGQADLFAVKTIDFEQARFKMRTTEQRVCHRWHTPDRSHPKPLGQRSC